MARKTKPQKADPKQARNRARNANKRKRAGRRRGRRTLHHIMVVLFVLAAGAVLSLTVFFKIDSIVVTGADRYFPEEIIETSGVQREDNLLRVPAKDIRQALLETYPYIEAVEVRRRYPSTVEIEVTQSKPAGALTAGDEEYLLITRDGKVLERGLLLIPGDVPLIKGVPAGNVQPGQYLGQYEPEPKADGETAAQTEARAKRNQEAKELADEQITLLTMMIKLFAAMEETGFTDITNVDLTNPLNIRIMYENRMLLELGSEGELAYKLRFVRKALDELKPNAHGSIDATYSVDKRIYYKAAEGYDNWGNRIDGDDGEEAESMDLGEEKQDDL